MEPLGVSLVPAGTPVLDASGLGPEHTEPPPVLLELVVLVDSPPLEELVALAEPPPLEELVVLAEPPLPVVVDDEVSLLLHAAPPATVAAVRTKKKRVRMINLLPGRAGRVPQEGVEERCRARAGARAVRRRAPRE